MADVKLDIGLAIQANNKVIADVTKALEGLNKTLGETESAGKKASDSANQLGNIFKGAFLADIAVRSLVSVKDAIVDLGTTILVDGVKAAEEYETALTSFNFALSSVGGFTKQASNDFEEFASTIQKSLGIADDSVLKVGATLVNLTGVTGPKLQELTQGIVDLSARLGVDLDTAARRVAIVIENGGNSLEKYGINVRGATTEAQRLDAVLQGLQTSAGAAAAQSNTLAGAQAVLRLSYSDVLKTIAENLTKNVTLIALLKSVSTIFNQLSEDIKKNGQSYRQLVSSGILFFISSIEVALDIYNLFSRTITGSVAGIKVVINAIARAFYTIQEATLSAHLAVNQFFNTKYADTISKELENVRAKLQSAKNDYTTAKTELTAAIDGPSEASKRLGSAISQVRQAVLEADAATRNGAESSVVAVNNKKASQDKLNESIKEENRLRQEQLAKQGEQVLARTQGEDPNKKFEAELAALDAFQTAKLEKERGHQAEIDAINAEFDAARLVLQEEKDAAIEAKKVKEIEDLMARNEVLRQLDEEKYANEIAQNQKAIDEKLKAQQISEVKKDQLRLKEKKREEALLRERLQLTAEFFGNLSALSETGSRTLFNIGKRAAQAEAIVQGALAIQKALASAPPPFNYALAAAVAVRTGVNIQRIQQQQFQAGTDFVRGPSGIDNVPALLTRGERVISREGNEDLTQFLQDQGPQNEILLEISSKLDRLSPNVTVEIGGKEIANVVREQVRAGRVIA